MKYLLPLILILFLTFTLIGDCDVIWKYTTEITVASAQSITIPLHTDVMVDDLLIVYISKDDPNLVWAHEDWTGICNLHSGTQNSLYMAWRKVTQADLDTPAKDWTWQEESGAESWIGEILTYRGQDLTNPIHNSDTAFFDHDAAPIAPSVGFGGVWVSPTNFVDSGEEWDGENLVYDGDTSTYANRSNIPTTSWSDYLELTIDAISCSKVRFWALYNAAYVGQISLDVYYLGGWHNIYEGAYAGVEWVEKAIGSTETVSAMQVKFYNNSEATAAGARIFEADFWDVTPLAAGSLVLQVFGCDDDDGGYVVPSPLASRFNTAANNVGGAGGDEGGISGTGNTGEAVFEMGTEEEWVAATVIIEAAAEEPPEGLTWNTKTITKWNTKEVTAINTQ